MPPAPGLTQRLHNHIDSLTLAGGFRSRAVFTEGNRQGVGYILRQMRRSTGRCWADTFRIPRRGGRGSSPLANAVAVVPGASDSLLVVCAHLDATADRDPGWRRGWMSMPAPGAVDNATGIAAMLEALALAAHAPKPPHYTLMFIACNAEERNLDYANPRDHHLGSRHAAETLRRQGKRVKGVIAMDMVGFSPDGNYLPLFATPRSGWLARGLYDLNARLRLGLILPPAFPACDRSDNDSFNRGGFPSVLFMESCAPWRSMGPHHPRNPGYHSPRDLSGLINYSMLEQVTRLVYSYLVSAQ